MNDRFVEYDKEIYLVIGIGYRNVPKGYKDAYYDKEEEYFELASIVDCGSIARASITTDTICISIDSCKEITDQKVIESLIILYGYNKI